MAIALDGSGLTVEKVVRIARHGEEVEIPEHAIAAIKKCRTMLEKKIKAQVDIELARIGT